MSFNKMIAVIMVSSMLVGCAQNSYPGSGIMSGGNINKSDIGTAAGAIGGGVLGYQFGGGAGQALATVGGALLGGMLGRSIGGSLDNADRAAYDNASQYALETGRPQSWRNSGSGHYGTIQPYRSYVNNYGDYCREYNQTIYVDGERHSAHGTACREPDGTWLVVG